MSQLETQNLTRYHISLGDETLARGRSEAT
jgi:hypothetical protein